MPTTEISYYAVLDDYYAKGPSGLIRRRPSESGTTDEVYTRDGSWKPTSKVSKFYMRDPDFDLVLITPEEAAAIVEWFGDRTTPPPIAGGWSSQATAWSVSLVGDTAFEALQARFGLTPHGTAGEPFERDPGFKVLRNDSTTRLSLNFNEHARKKAWSVTLKFLGEAPDAQTVAQVRSEVLAAAAELGFTAEDDRTFLDAKSGRVAVLPPARMPGTKPPRHQLFRLDFNGTLNKEWLKALQKQLRLSDDGDLTDEEDTEFGETYLPNDGTYRSQLWLSRADTDRWTFGVSNEGRRPPEERLQQWRDQVFEVATEAGLTLADEWRSPTPANPTPMPAPAVRTGFPVERSYSATATGTLTQETLTGIREQLGLSRRGKLDNDWDQDFGAATLRDEPGTPVTLNLYRRAAGKWTFSVVYQGEPPAAELLEQVRAGIRTAASDAGLTIEAES